jgi:DNA-binding LytR/AlgR family response regulator
MINHTYLIVDDSPADVALLQHQLSLIPILKQVYVCETVNEALAYLMTQPCHLLFLDINLPGQLGIDWLRNSPHRPPVIVTTSSPDYAPDCYDLEVVDYLVKPYTTDRLMRAISRTFDDKLSKPRIDSQNIFLHVNRRLRKFNFHDIMYFEAFAAYTKIHTVSEVVITSESISMLENRLPSSQFIRIQKSFIINLEKLTAIEHRAVWLNETKLPIGQRFRDTIGSLFRSKSSKVDASDWASHDV